MFIENRGWVLILFLLLIDESSIQTKFVNAATTVRPDELLMNQETSNSKKRVTTALNQQDALIKYVNQNSLQKTTSSFFSVTKSTMPIATQQGLFNLNRRKTGNKQGIKIVQKVPLQRNQRRKPKKRVTKESTRSLPITTANTYQYERATANKLETKHTVVFVKTWTKVTTPKIRPILTEASNILQNNPAFLQSRPTFPTTIQTNLNNRRTSPRNDAYYYETGNQPAISRPLNNRQPIRNIPQKNVNRNPPEYEYEDEPLPTSRNRNTRKPTTPSYYYDDYYEKPNYNTKNNNRNPIPTRQKLRTTTKRPLYYDDDEYYESDDNRPNQQTKIPPRNTMPGSMKPGFNNKPSNKYPDEEYEDDEANDTPPQNKKTEIGKMTTRWMDEEEEEEVTTKKLKVTKATTIKKGMEENEEVVNEDSKIEQQEDQFSSIVTTVAYVPGVPKVTSKIVTFPPNLDKNGPDPDYKDKTIDLDAEITTTPYKPKLGNIFDPNFGISR